MKYIDNLQAVANLQPDYMGFIFYDRSPRNFEGIIPELPKNIKKTGVFVNELPEILISLAEEYQLDALQLHGDETVAYIEEIKRHLERSREVEIIKVFGIKDDFDFSLLEPYQDVVDYFLFDTKGKERGGNGVKFDWSVLKDYPYQKPFFLSGGIGIEDAKEVKKIQDSGLPVYAVDINSRFEKEPGLKNIKLVKKFKQSVITSI